MDTKVVLLAMLGVVFSCAKTKESNLNSNLPKENEVSGSMEKEAGRETNLDLKKWQPVKKIEVRGKEEYQFIGKTLGVGDLDGDGNNEFLSFEYISQEPDPDKALLEKIHIYSLKNGNLTILKSYFNLASKVKDVSARDKIVLLSKSKGSAKILIGSELGHNVRAYELNLNNDEDMKLVREVTNDQEGFGTSICSFENNDSSDFAVGALRATIDGRKTGAVFLYDGKDLTKAPYVFKPKYQDLFINAEFGTSISCNGDFNGDGINDIAISAPHYAGFGVKKGQDKGRVFVFDSNSKDLVFSWDGREEDYSALGTSVAFVSDLDGDNKADLLVGHLSHKGAKETKECGYVISSKKKLLKAFNRDVGRNWCLLTPLNDLNGDGVPELALLTVVQDDYWNQPKNTQIINGKDLTPLYSDFGFSPTAAGDIDGDGKNDIIFGDIFDNNNSKTYAGKFSVQLSP